MIDILIIDLIKGLNSFPFVLPLKVIMAISSSAGRSVTNCNLQEIDGKVESEWVRQRQINSYVLQVEPDRFELKDTAILDYKESLQMKRSGMSCLSDSMSCPEQ